VGENRRKRRYSRTDKHHRKGQRYGGTNSYPPGNLVTVPIKEHEAFHTLFKDPTPTNIAEQLNETWLDPEWMMIPIQKESFAAVMRAIGHLVPEEISKKVRKGNKK